MKRFPIQLVSLGTGDPELITIKALKALQAADCIFCPETQSGGSRSADIVLQLDIPKAAIHRFPLPMSKQREKALAAYYDVASQAAQLQGEGRKVCIVAEGDAGLYSSVHYVIERLQAMRLPVEQIAGIPAFVAAGAHDRLHIVKQEERLTIIPGTATEDDLERLVSKGGTVVIMKLSQCATAVKSFIRQHPDHQYHYYECLGTAEEVCLNDTTLIAVRQFPYFSMLMVFSHTCR